MLHSDEATSAVDSATAAAFRTALRRAIQASNCGVLIVAHRLATAREADWVERLEAGRVIEEAAPAALIEKKGRFAALLALEAAGRDWCQVLA